MTTRRTFFKSLAALPLVLFAAHSKLAIATTYTYGEVKFIGSIEGIESIWVDAKLVWRSDWNQEQLKFFRSIKGRGEGFRIKQELVEWEAA